MARYVLFGLVSLVSAAAVYLIATRAGAKPPPRGSDRAAALRTTGLTEGDRAPRPAELPSSRVPQLPSPGVLVFDPQDMSGPPEGLSPVERPPARVAPNLEDGPPSS